jgi:hypothetical protein
MDIKLIDTLISLLKQLNSLIDGAEKADAEAVKESANGLFQEIGSVVDNSDDLEESLVNKLSSIVDRFKDNDDPLDYVEDIISLKDEFDDILLSVEELKEIAMETLENVDEAVEKVGGFFYKIKAKVKENGEEMWGTIKQEDKDWHEAVAASWKASKDKSSPDHGFAKFMKKFASTSGSTIKDDFKAIGKFIHSMASSDQDELLAFAEGIKNSAEHFTVTEKGYMFDDSSDVVSDA